MHGGRRGPALQHEAVGCEQRRFFGERRSSSSGGKEEIRYERRYDQQAEKVSRIDSREAADSIANQILAVPGSRPVTPRQHKTGEHEKGADSQISAAKNGLSK